MAEQDKPPISLEEIGELVDESIAQDRERKEQMARGFLYPALTEESRAEIERRETRVVLKPKSLADVQYSVRQIVNGIEAARAKSQTLRALRQGILRTAAELSSEVAGMNSHLYPLRLSSPHTEYYVHKIGYSVADINSTLRTVEGQIEELLGLLTSLEKQIQPEQETEE